MNCVKCAKNSSRQGCKFNCCSFKCCTSTKGKKTCSIYIHNDEDYFKKNEIMTDGYYKVFKENFTRVTL